MIAAPSRWRQLALLATAELFGMSVWFAGSAVAPILRAQLGFSAAQAAWLTSAVQLGFVAGTLIVAVLNLSDIIPARWLFAACALLASLANAALLPAHTFGIALATRMATGMALAGVYPPAMKMAATWFKAERGLAIGMVVAALTAGKAVPYLLEGAHFAVAPTVLVPSAAALVGALLIATAYRDGPFAFPARPFSWHLTGLVARDPVLRRVTGGYLGHMWELYAFWAWVPAFLAASFAARGAPTDRAGAWAFACVAIGAIGSIWGGLAADRRGRTTVVRVALTLSGVCSLVSGVVFGGPVWLVLGLCLVWGIAVIADSAQFSALVTEHAPPHAVGTALTLQTSLGFLLTIASIQLVPVIAAAVGWRWAMAILALGPAAALAVVRRLTPRGDLA
ncbi:MAG TPA: MFS transporter [Gemmatimonadales bacterium]|jgi:MFS family permease|nr:MFS transporter [Gemmatimonadales bacterium]